MSFVHLASSDNPFISIQKMHLCYLLTCFAICLQQSHLIWAGIWAGVWAGGATTMARHTHRLTDIKVRSLKAEGLYADGDGLYARVTASGKRGWIFRFKLFDRMRDMGLGTHPGVSLAEARKLASEARAFVRRGIDPIEERKKQSAPAPVNFEMTFDLRPSSSWMLARGAGRIPNTGSSGETPSRHMRRLSLAKGCRCNYNRRRIANPEADLAG